MYNLSAEGSDMWINSTLRILVKGLRELQGLGCKFWLFGSQCCLQSDDKWLYPQWPDHPTFLICPLLCNLWTALKVNNKVRFFIQGKGKEKGHRNLEHLRYVSIPTVVPAMNSCYPWSTWKRCISLRDKKWVNLIYLCEQCALWSLINHMPYLFSDFWIPIGS